LIQLFYTIVFWDPEKIAEQLRKASVSVVNVTPGRETIFI
jgi:preprotein translocase subunit SecY